MKDPLTSQEEDTKQKQIVSKMQDLKMNFWHNNTHLVTVSLVFITQIDRERLKDKDREFTTHT